MAAIGMRSVVAVMTKPAALGDVVAVAHPRPAGGAPTWSFNPSSRRSWPPPHFGVAELALVGGLGGAAQLHGHGLHAVADAQHRQAAVEHRCGARGAPARGRFRAAGQDDALGAEGRDLGRVVVPGPDFAVHADLADAAGDQLGVLGAEIEDEDLVVVDAGRHAGTGSKAGRKAGKRGGYERGTPARPLRVAAAISRRGSSAAPW
jgi:hypothetical protein